MSRVGNLNAITDPIKAAEQDHEGSKVSLRLSPLATFILEGGLQPRLGGSRTRVATELMEAAALDWLESQGITPDDEAFRAKYLRWLTRPPLDPSELGLHPDVGEVYEVVKI